VIGQNIYMKEVNISHCEIKFKCPKTWGSLTTTENPKVRFCGECQQNVHLVDDIENFPKDKKCVMIPLGADTELMGEILPPQQKTCNIN
jgi:hypothetical protein